LKYLLLVLFLGLIWLLWRHRSRAAERPPAESEKPEEAMVECAHCGVFLPRSEALAEAGRHYCSEAHRQAGVRDK